MSELIRPNITTPQFATNVIVSSASAVTLTYASSYNQVITGSSAQTLIMPVVSTLPAISGTYTWRVKVLNKSTQTTTINSSGGNQIATIPTNTSSELICVDNTLGTGILPWVVDAGGSSSSSNSTSFTGGTVSGDTNFTNGLTANTISASTLTLSSVSGSIVGTDNTQTLTNKTIKPRVVNVTQSDTPTTNIDNGDIFRITGLSQTITSMSSGMSGTPYHGQKIEWQITDNGTARAISWGASFASTTGRALPTTTVISTLLRVTTAYNSVTSKHECVEFDSALSGGSSKVNVDLKPASSDIQGLSTEPLLVSPATTNELHWSELQYDDTTAMIAPWFVSKAVTIGLTITTITIRIAWYATAITGNVKWQVYLKNKPAGQVMDVAYDTTTAHQITVTPAGTTLQVVYSDITITPNASELVVGNDFAIGIKRITSVGGEMVGNANLVNATLIFN